TVMLAAIAPPSAVCRPDDDSGSMAHAASPARIESRVTGSHETNGVASQACETSGGRSRNGKKSDCGRKGRERAVNEATWYAPSGPATPHIHPSGSVQMRIS